MARPGFEPGTPRFSVAGRPTRPAVRLLFAPRRSPTSCAAFTSESQIAPAQTASGDSVIDHTSMVTNHTGVEWVVNVELACGSSPASRSCGDRHPTTVRPVQRAFRGLRLLGMQPSWRALVEEMLSGWGGGPDEPQVRLRFAVPELIVTHSWESQRLPGVSFPSMPQPSSGSAHWMTGHARPALHRGSRRPASIARNRRLVARRRCSACAGNRWRTWRFHQWEQRRPSSDCVPNAYIHIVGIDATACHDANEARQEQQPVPRVVVSDLEITYRVTQFAPARRSTDGPPTGQVRPLPPRCRPAGTHVIWTKKKTADHHLHFPAAARTGRARAETVAERGLDRTDRSRRCGGRHTRAGAAWVARQPAATAAPACAVPAARRSWSEPRLARSGLVQTQLGSLDVRKNGIRNSDLP
jgi:hypothetical protein